MTIGIQEFSSPQELLKYIDNMLNDLRRKLGELLRLIEELRAKSERDEKLLKLIAFLAGGTIEESPIAKETVIEIEKVKIMLNPTAKTELEVLEEIAESINAKITRLHAIRRGLERLAQIDVETRIRVIFQDYIPKAVIITL
ncbi:hypothetical protein [Hyperthermus butylicus]|uniref:Uncharacterized protein n=1 Tax=Hyperthermus butylicus (strain DSM 5456 / JCM 9403 / PLM1-5) TaxID=415426 RepID=A2BLS9_HYPBU|nr:hypothetical protein [Hyperthermus butylicus]ABM80940.1 hypothetical protein Hbut_1097 [Hyperthermus butylicus DSM 5456]